MCTLRLVQCVPKVLCVLILACPLMVGGRRLIELSLHSLLSHFYKMSMFVSLHVSALFISADRTLFLCPSTPALILTLRFSTTHDLAHFPNMVQTFWGDAPDLTILLSSTFPYYLSSQMQYLLNESSNEWILFLFALVICCSICSMTFKH